MTGVQISILFYIWYDISDGWRSLTMLCGVFQSGLILNVGILLFVCLVWLDYKAIRWFKGNRIKTDRMERIFEHVCTASAVFISCNKGETDAGVWGVRCVWSNADRSDVCVLVFLAIWRETSFPASRLWRRTPAVCGWAADASSVSHSLRLLLVMINASYTNRF